MVPMVKGQRNEQLRLSRVLTRFFCFFLQKPCREVKNLICTMLDECKSSCLRKCNRARENPDKEQYSTEALNQGQCLLLGIKQHIVND